jgi:hypothetical protein
VQLPQDKAVKKVREQLDRALADASRASALRPDSLECAAHALTLQMQLVHLDSGMDQVVSCALRKEDSKRSVKARADRMEQDLGKIRTRLDALKAALDSGAAKPGSRTEPVIYLTMKWTPAVKDGGAKAVEKVAVDATFSRLDVVQKDKITGFLGPSFVAKRE